MNLAHCASSPPRALYYSNSSGRAQPPTQLSNNASILKPPMLPRSRGRPSSGSSVTSATSATSATSDVVPPSGTARTARRAGPPTPSAGPSTARTAATMRSGSSAVLPPPGSASGARSSAPKDPRIIGRMLSTVESHVGALEQMVDAAVADAAGGPSAPAAGSPAGTLALPAQAKRRGKHAPSPLDAYNDYEASEDVSIHMKTSVRSIDQFGRLVSPAPKSSPKPAPQRQAAVDQPTSFLAAIPSIAEYLHTPGFRAAHPDEDLAETMHESVAAYKLRKRREPAAIKIQRWARMLHKRRMFLKWRSRRYDLRATVFRVWMLSWRASKLTRTSCLRKFFLLWKDEYLDTRHTKEMSQKLFASTTSSGKLSSIVLNLFFSSRVTDLSSGNRRKERKSRRQRMKGYMSVKARARAERRAKRAADRAERLHALGIRVDEKGRPIPSKKKRNQAAAAQGGASWEEEYILDELGKLSSESEDEGDDDDDEEADVFEQMRQTVEVRIKRAVLADWIMFIRRRKHNQAKAALALQRCSRMATVTGTELMWTGERLSLMFEMWRRYAVFKRYKRQQKGLPIFGRPLRQWNRFVDLYQARKMRERKALALAPRNCMRRWFVRWKMLKGYKDRLEARQQLTIQHYKLTLLRRFFLALRKQTRMRGKMIRRLRTVFDAWSFWAEHAAKRRRLFYTVKLRRDQALAVRMFKSWQDRRNTQALITCAAVSRIQEPANSITALMALHAWRGASLPYQFLDCWVRWARGIARRRLWRKFLFQYRRDSMRQMLRCILRAWKALVTRQSIPEDLTLEPNMSVADYRKYIRGLRAGDPAEDALDKAAMFTLLHEPPSNARRLRPPADPDSKPENQSLLHKAVEFADEQEVRRLLEDGADPNVTNSFGQTPLHLAAAHYSSLYVSIVVLLVECGAKVGMQDAWGHTPLELAFNPAIRTLLSRHVARLQRYDYTDYERDLYRDQMTVNLGSLSMRRMWQAVTKLLWARHKERQEAAAQEEVTKNDRKKRMTAQDLEKQGRAAQTPQQAALDLGAPAKPDPWGIFVGPSARMTNLLSERADGTPRWWGADTFENTEEVLDRATVTMAEKEATTPAGMAQLITKQETIAERWRRYHAFAADRDRLLLANTLMRESLNAFHKSNPSFSGADAYRNAVSQALALEQQRELARAASNDAKPRRTTIGLVPVIPRKSVVQVPPSLSDLDVPPSDAAYLLTSPAGRPRTADATKGTTADASQPSAPTDPTAPAAGAAVAEPVSRNSVVSHEDELLNSLQLAAVGADATNMEIKRDMGIARRKVLGADARKRRMSTAAEIQEMMNTLMVDGAGTPESTEPTEAVSVQEGDAPVQVRSREQRIKEEAERWRSEVLEWEHASRKFDQQIAEATRQLLTAQRMKEFCEKAHARYLKDLQCVEREAAHLQVLENQASTRMDHIQLEINTAVDSLTRITQDREAVGAALDRQRAKMMKAKAKMDAELETLFAAMASPKAEIAEVTPKIAAAEAAAAEKHAAYVDLQTRVGDSHPSAAKARSAWEKAKSKADGMKMQVADHEKLVAQTEAKMKAMQAEFAVLAEEVQNSTMTDVTKFETLRELENVQRPLVQDLTDQHKKAQLVYYRVLFQAKEVAAGIDLLRQRVADAVVQLANATAEYDAIKAKEDQSVDSIRKARLNRFAMHSKLEGASGDQRSPSPTESGDEAADAQTQGAIDGATSSDARASPSKTPAPASTETAALATPTAFAPVASDASAEATPGSGTPVDVQDSSGGDARPTPVDTSGPVAFGSSSPQSRPAAGGSDRSRRPRVESVDVVVAPAAPADEGPDIADDYDNLPESSGLALPSAQVKSANPADMDDLSDLRRLYDTSAQLLFVEQRELAKEIAEQEEAKEVAATLISTDEMRGLERSMTLSDIFQRPRTGKKTVVVDVPEVPVVADAAASTATGTTMAHLLHAARSPPPRRKSPTKPSLFARSGAPRSGTPMSPDPNRASPMLVSPTGGNAEGFVPIATTPDAEQRHPQVSAPVVVSPVPPATAGTAALSRDATDTKDKEVNMPTPMVMPQSTPPKQTARVEEVPVPEPVRENAPQEQEADHSPPPEMEVDDDVGSQPHSLAADEQLFEDEERPTRDAGDGGEGSDSDDQEADLEPVDDYAFGNFGASHVRRSSVHHEDAASLVIHHPDAVDAAIWRGGTEAVPEPDWESIQAERQRRKAAAVAAAEAETILQAQLTQQRSLTFDALSMDPTNSATATHATTAAAAAIPAFSVAAATEQLDQGEERAEGAAVLNEATLAAHNAQMSASSRRPKAVAAGDGTARVIPASPVRPMVVTNVPGVASFPATSSVASVARLMSPQPVSTSRRSTTSRKSAPSRGSSAPSRRSKAAAKRVVGGDPKELEARKKDMADQAAADRAFWLDRKFQLDRYSRGYRDAKAVAAAKAAGVYTDPQASTKTTARGATVTLVSPSVNDEDTDVQTIETGDTEEQDEEVDEEGIGELPSLDTRQEGLPRTWSMQPTAAGLDGDDEEGPSDGAPHGAGHKTPSHGQVGSHTEPRPRRVVSPPLVITPAIGIAQVNASLATQQAGLPALAGSIGIKGMEPSAALTQLRGMGHSAGFSDPATDHVTVMGETATAVIRRRSWQSNENLAEGSVASLRERSVEDAPFGALAARPPMPYTSRSTPALSGVDRGTVAREFGTGGGGGGAAAPLRERVFGSGPMAVEAAQAATAKDSYMHRRGPALVSMYKLGLWPELRPNDPYFRTFSNAAAEFGVMDEEFGDGHSDEEEHEALLAEAEAADAPLVEQDEDEADAEDGAVPDSGSPRSDRQSPSGPPSPVNASNFMDGLDLFPAQKSVDSSLEGVQMRTAGRNYNAQGHLYRGMPLSKSTTALDSPDGFSSVRKYGPLAQHLSPGRVSRPSLEVVGAVKPVNQDSRFGSTLPSRLHSRNSQVEESPLPASARKAARKMVSRHNARRRGDRQDSFRFLPQRRKRGGSAIAEAAQVLLDQVRATDEPLPADVGGTSPTHVRVPDSPDSNAYTSRTDETIQISTPHVPEVHVHSVPHRAPMVAGVPAAAAVATTTTLTKSVPELQPPSQVPSTLPSARDAAASAQQQSQLKDQVWQSFAAQEPSLATQAAYAELYPSVYGNTSNNIPTEELAKMAGVTGPRRQSAGVLVGVKRFGKMGLSKDLGDYRRTHALEAEFGEEEDESKSAAALAVPPAVPVGVPMTVPVLPMQVPITPIAAQSAREQPMPIVPAAAPPVSPVSVPQESAASVHVVITGRPPAHSIDGVGPWVVEGAQPSPMSTSKPASVASSKPGTPAAPTVAAIRANIAAGAKQAASRQVGLPPAARAVTAPDSMRASAVVPLPSIADSGPATVVPRVVPMAATAAPAVVQESPVAVQVPSTGVQAPATDAVPQVETAMMEAGAGDAVEPVDTMMEARRKSATPTALSGSAFHHVPAPAAAPAPIPVPVVNPLSIQVNRYDGSSGPGSALPSHRSTRSDAGGSRPGSASSRPGSAASRPGSASSRTGGVVPSEEGSAAGQRRLSLVGMSKVRGRRRSSFLASLGVTEPDAEPLSGRDDSLARDSVVVPGPEQTFAGMDIHGSKRSDGTVAEEEPVVPPRLDSPMEQVSAPTVTVNVEAKPVTMPLTSSGASYPAGRRRSFLDSQFLAGGLGTLNFADVSSVSKADPDLSQWDGAKEDDPSAALLQKTAASELAQRGNTPRSTNSAGSVQEAGSGYRLARQLRRGSDDSDAVDDHGGNGKRPSTTGAQSRSGPRANWRAAMSDKSLARSIQRNMAYVRHGKGVTAAMMKELEFKSQYLHVMGEEGSDVLERFAVERRVHTLEEAQAAEPLDRLLEFRQQREDGMHHVSELSRSVATTLAKF